MCGSSDADIYTHVYDIISYIVYMKLFITYKLSVQTLYNSSEHSNNIYMCVCIYKKIRANVKTYNHWFQTFVANHLRALQRVNSEGHHGK